MSNRDDILREMAFFRGNGEGIESWFSESISDVVIDALANCEKRPISVEVLNPTNSLPSSSKNFRSSSGKLHWHSSLVPVSGLIRYARPLMGRSSNFLNSRYSSRNTGP